MEFKVRTESESLLYKMFNAKKKGNKVRPEIVPALLREFNEDIQVDSEDLSRVISEINPDAALGELDYDEFSNIMVHYLAEQARRETNMFGDKQLIHLTDFPDP